MISITQAIGQGYKQQGIQEGMQQEKLYIAKNMLYKLHLVMKAVSEATGLIGVVPTK